MQFSVPAGQSWSILIEIPLCITQPGRVRIEGVALDNPTGGLRVEAFATGPNAFASGVSAPGSEAVSLTDLHTDYVIGGEPITAVCPDPDEVDTWVGGSMVAVQVSKSSAGLAFSQALNITYQTDSSEGRLWIPYGIALCDKPQESPCPLPESPQVPGSQ
jgi:hypothetical protein